ncbi:hypothetical protein DMP07_00490 [Slackia faecicanis]|uniref:Uncharacterized protein n=1 Tax=Slackia faecicanis TaxID=255723 RepID=A0A3N0AGT7_9ACTN|nr:hypothetical protein [Slackia faecicanis]MDO5359006.1 hypothetical protein [Slackia faecicanis]RNL21367.1 hypothetical protein DMP07_00490 [Slackia faecicanis]
MDNASLCHVCDFLNLTFDPEPMHWLDEPTGHASALAKANLGHQMRYSVESLESELACSEMRHVLQLVFEGGTERDPEYWSLHADGACVASGSGAFARACFRESAQAFKDVCRDAVEAAHGNAVASLDAHDYRLLRICRDVASIA